MKKLMLRLLAVVAFVASVSVSCSEVSFIEINPPADLQSKIDSIQNVKDSLAALLGDKKMIDITVPIVGAEDFSSAYFGARSQAFPIPTGKLLGLEFINHGSGVNNYNNWNLVITNPIGFGEEGYKEYLILRADNWANVKDENSIIINTECPDRNGNGDMWDDFKDIMTEAHVTMTVDHSSTGIISIEATAVGKDGSVIKNYCTQNITATEDVWAFLTTDGSWFELKSAYTAPSKILEVPDEMAASITVTGTPAAIEVGSTDFWGNGVATVTYTDGTSAVADTADITFVVPDLSTVGTKTILYSYSKTKQGNYGKAVAGTYTLEVTNPIVALEASANAYLIGGAKYVTLSPGAVKVIAEYADGTKAPLKASQFSVVFADDKVVYEGVEGTYENAYTVTYASASGSVVETTGDFVIAKSSHPAQDTPVGAEDFTNGWWSTFTQDWAVAPYESQTVSMTLASAAAGNFQSPCTVLRKADMSEYGVLRMDHYGWGASVGDACALITATSNWNWDTFLTILNGSQIAITVSNHGDNTASVRYHIVSNNGETHFQYYDNIAIDSADFQFALVTEGSHLIFD